MSENAKEVWAKWPEELLTDDYAAKRIKSAENSKLTPILVNHEDAFAYFQGEHGRYETFLDRCPCGDFTRAKRPCKHIFRLAMELGLLSGNTKSDQSAIPTVVRERMSLPDLLDKVELMTKEQQLALKEASKAKTGGKILIGDDLNYLLSEGYIKLVKEPSARMKYAPVVCQDWYSRDQLHKFLKRKFDGLDPGMYEASINFCGEDTGLQTVVPSDAAMKELIKRGYYDENGKRLKKV